MQAKKKLLSRFASWTGAVLVVAAIAGVVGLLVDAEDRERFSEQQERAKKQRVESSRAYLAELAKRIGRLPVDATLVSEVESRFFDEQASGPFYVWAMDTRGDFAFGVPRSAFDKLNAVYDREVTPRLKEGVFLDRQTFLMSLVDDSDEIGPELVSEDKALVAESRAVELVERGRRWQLNRWEPENAFVVSAPLKAEDGSALGSIYLKQTPVRERDYYRRDGRIEGLLRVAAASVGLSIAFLWVLLPTWVYVDARERGVRRAPLFAFLTVLSSLVGLVVYLIARPEQPRRLSCPGCAREVNGGAFCPHCGRDLSSAICPACRYPLKPEWAFCPSCRTEIKPQGAGTPVTEAG
jgi:Double zinc ribbon